MGTSGVVSDDTHPLVVPAAIVSIFLSALLVPIAPRFGHWVAGLLRSPTEIVADSADRPEPLEVSIIGFGPAGQIAPRPLMDKGVRVLVIDLNRAGVHKAEQLGSTAKLVTPLNAKCLNTLACTNAMRLSSPFLITGPP